MLRTNWVQSDTVRAGAFDSEESEAIVHLTADETLTECRYWFIVISLIYIRMSNIKSIRPLEIARFDYRQANKHQGR